MATLPADVVRGLDLSRADLGALPSSWYDSRLYGGLFDAVVAANPARDPVELATEAARVTLEHNLRGIYARLFALMATPGLYARYAQKMWDTHYDDGEVRIEMVEPNIAHHTVRGWSGHHRFACAINIASGAILYEMMGLRNVRITARRCAFPECSSVYTWDR